MATKPIAITSFDTALCIIPPLDRSNAVNTLRSLYDKAWERWPQHINLVYPFVHPEKLPEAKARIEAAMRSSTFVTDLGVSLDQPGYFEHNKGYTVFLGEGESPASALDEFRQTVMEALGQPLTTSKLHLTVGQSVDKTDAAREFLLNKVRRLPRLEFPITSLAILVRETPPGQQKEASCMRLWGVISLPGTTGDVPKLSEFWLPSPNEQCAASALDDTELEHGYSANASSAADRRVEQGVTYTYNQDLSIWTPYVGDGRRGNLDGSLTISSYNVLIDSEYPPARDRDPSLMDAILSESAAADILVLQEVSDEFLSYILAATEIQHHYPYSSHGPPDQADIGPLPNLRNIVLLSRMPFTWELIPFQRRHKAALVASFAPHIDEPSNSFIVAGVHLTCGLTDGSVAAKKVQMQNLLSFLRRRHPSKPWIIAGDFNITTSTYTIESALKHKSISQETAKTLESIETMLSEADLLDTWSVARIEATDEPLQEPDDLYDGEHGATFNPRSNVLAAAISGTSNNRPQRYDRILLRNQDTFRISRFNFFGLAADSSSSSTPSDHWGIRTSLDALPRTGEGGGNETATLKQRAVVEQRLPPELEQSAGLHAALAAQGMIPTDEDIEAFKSAFMYLQDILLETAEERSSQVPLIVVPVGSYALDTWTSTSDIDCLCVGTISPKTFFTLARQRIRRAADDIHLIRKVEANTGTMLELSVRGINVDLQYCPAARIVERWSELPTLHHTDPIFNLSMLSLRKLKPYRDITYIQRTLPSLGAFRLAYRTIKLWAIQRGVYSSKFGFLGGIHITLMLTCICKQLAHDIGAVSAPSLVKTFFHHYARFDWKNDMVFDAFFHKKGPRYHRNAREPMVVLGYHAPNSNAAHTSSTPGLATLVKEFAIADQRLSADGMSWERFFDLPDGAGTLDEFLGSHDRYVQINMQYWGRSLAKGKGLVGWVESRSLLLVVDINKALPDIEVRIWPSRFTSTESGNTDTGYEGSYLIGISWSAGSTSHTTKDGRLQLSETLQKAFSRFLDTIRGEEKHYDPNTCWVDISLAKPGQVKDLRPDNTAWGADVADADLDSNEEEEEEGHSEEDRDHDTAPRLPVRPLHASAVGVKSKLRPASDVLSRLRWDPNCNPEDFIVGYEDRFVGAKEMGLERWKSESTHDEFVPMHRILYFRRKADGVVVWDRNARLDRIFGSGIGYGDGAE